MVLAACLGVQEGETPVQLEGEGCAVTPGGWGAPPNGNNPGALLHAKFDELFGAELVVDGHVFEDAQEVTDTLPVEGGDPLLNHAVALRINLAMGAAGYLDGSLAGVTVAGGEFDGTTAEELLALAVVALADPDRATSDYSTLIDALSGLNEETFGCAGDVDCPEGQEMVDGQCVPVAEDCPEGEEMLEGACVPVSEDQPACPNVAATARQDRSVRVSWGATDADAVVLERMTGDTWVVLTTSATAPGSFVDGGLEVGTTYTYRVSIVVGEETIECEVLEVTAIPYFQGAATLAFAVVGGVAAYAMLRRRG